MAAEPEKTRGATGKDIAMGAAASRQSLAEHAETALVLTEPAYIILVALASRPAHGYRIMQIINDVFRTGLRVGPGTLYRTLQRLMAAGLIDEVDTVGEEEDERRRAYRLTDSGLASIKTEVRRLDVLVRLAKAQLAVTADV
jgi:DNA-binding PadR family transcriptional regulator